MKRFFKVLGGALALVCLVGVGIFASCSTDTSVLGGDFSSEALEFLGSKAVSPLEISFRFSRPVRVVSLDFEPEVPIASINDGELVTVTLGEALVAGMSITADLLVEDDAGNTLNVLVPFLARNDRIPRLLITELRTEATKPKAEFIEFKTLEAGNLGALRVFIPGNTKNPLAFEFPPVEVAAGEYILLHLRTRDEDTGATNETGSNLGLSGGNEALAEARDFWIPGSEKLLHKTDIVYLMDQDDNVIDAVMLSATPDSWWSKDCFVAAAELLHQQGAWLSADGTTPGPVDAVISANTTATRSISRDEAASDTNGAGDWYITAQSKASPGKLNNPERYMPAN